MKFKDIWVWIFIFGSVSLVAVFLYQQSKTNLEQLEFQSLKAISLAKQSLLENYYSYNVQLEEYLARNFFKLSDDDPTSPASVMVAIVDVGRSFDITKIQSIAGDELPSVHMRPRSIQIIRKDSVNFLLIQDQLFDFTKYTARGSKSIDYKKLESQLPGSIAWDFQGISEVESPSGQFLLHHILPVHELMKHNFQTQFFDRLYVLSDSGTILWPAENEGIQLLSPEEATPEITEDEVTLINKGESKVKLRIGTKAYEGFVAPFNLGDKSFFLVGTKDSAAFRQVAYRIDFSILSIFLLCLAVIFISIPVISIFTMSEGDVLTKGRMFGLGISLIVLSLVIGFSLAFSQNRQASPTYDSVIREIEGVFSKQIEAINMKLSLWEHTVDSSLQDSTLLPLPPGINELIQFSTDGRISRLVFPTPDGLRTVDFQTNPFISIASRDYVQKLVADGDEGYLSAHYSKSDGRLEGVISQRVNEDFGKAITFNLSEGGDMLDDHRYFIFKPDGQVLLKSDKVNTPVTNLQNVIGENKWAELHRLIINNDQPEQNLVWEIPIYVNGFEYLARLKRLPLEDFSSSVWLLFLIDEHLQDTLYILTTFETLAVLLPYFFVLGILGVLNMLANPLSTYLSVKKFSFSWYSPSLAKRNQFLLSNYILASLILLYLTVYWVVPLNLFTVFLWAVVFTCQAGLCNFILIHPQWVGKFGSKEFNFLAPAFLMWLIFVVILIYLSYISIAGPFFLLVIAIILVLLLMLVGAFFAMHQNRLPKLRPNFYTNTGERSLLKSLHYKLTQFWNFITQIQVEKRIFSINFLLWLMLIGLLPGYVLHRQIFFQEQFLWEIDGSRTVNQVQNQVNETFYDDLILAHEKLRRLNFSQLAKNEEKTVYNFISPKMEDMVASFDLPKNWRLGPEKKSFEIMDFFTRYIGDRPLFIGLVILLLLLSFNLLLRISKRIFLTDYLFSYYSKKLPTTCLDRRFNFITSIDSVKATEWISRHFQSDPRKRLFVNCMLEKDFSGEIPENIDSIIIHNIHTLINKEDFLQKMYQVKEHYFDSGRAVFIVSGISFPDMLEAISSVEERRLFAELMRSFLFHVVPLNFNLPSISIPLIGQSAGNLPSKEEDLKNKQLIQSKLFNDTKIYLLSQEIGFGGNSEALGCLLTDEIALDDWESGMTDARYEKSILSIQRYNKAYFTAIWQMLNLREKKMVYYFASEGFINYTNREVMTALLQKGVLTLNFQRDYLTLFSKSFRNYVLLFTSSEEQEAFRRDEKRKGNTKLIQAAAISFVFICIAIISFYDPTILDRTSAYISAAIGLAGTLYSFLHKGLRGLWRGEE